MAVNPVNGTNYSYNLSPSKVQPDKDGKCWLGAWLGIAPNQDQDWPLYLAKKIPQKILNSQPDEDECSFRIPGTSKFLSPSQSLQKFREADKAFVDMVGKRPKIIAIYQQWLTRFKYNPFPSTACYELDSKGQIPMITWEPSGLLPTDLSDLLDPDKKYLTKFIFQLLHKSGEIYEYARKWAEDAKAYEKPFFLRPFHEMNLTTEYPWTGWMNGGDENKNNNYRPDKTPMPDGPERFVEAWQLLYTLFKDVGADNATFVWCPNCDPGMVNTARDLGDYFPGPQYVDYFGADGYNRTASSFEGIFGETLEYFHARDKVDGKNTPVIICETSSFPTGKEKYIKELFEGAKNHRAEDGTRQPLAGVMWFNENKEGGGINEANWQIDARSNKTWNPHVKETKNLALDAFREAVKDKYFYGESFTPTVNETPRIFVVPKRKSYLEGELQRVTNYLSRRYTVTVTHDLATDPYGDAIGGYQLVLIDAGLVGEGKAYATLQDIVDVINVGDEVRRAAESEWVPSKGSISLTKALAEGDYYAFVMARDVKGNKSLLTIQSVQKVTVTPSGSKAPEPVFTFGFNVTSVAAQASDAVRLPDPVVTTGWGVKSIPADHHFYKYPGNDLGGVWVQRGQYEKDLSGYTIEPTDSSRYKTKTIIERMEVRYASAAAAFDSCPRDSRYFMEAFGKKAETFWALSDIDEKKNKECKDVAVDLAKFTKDELGIPYIAPFRNKAVLKPYAYLDNTRFGEEEWLGCRAASYAISADMWSEEDTTKARLEFDSAKTTINPDNNKVFARPGWAVSLGNFSSKTLEVEGKMPWKWWHPKMLLASFIDAIPEIPFGKKVPLFKEIFKIKDQQADIRAKIRIGEAKMACDKGDLVEINKSIGGLLDIVTGKTLGVSERVKLEAMIQIIRELEKYNFKATWAKSHNMPELYSEYSERFKKVYALVKDLLGTEKDFMVTMLKEEFEKVESGPSEKNK